MTFTEKGKEAVLQGQLIPQNQPCDKKQISISFKKRRHGLLMNLQMINNKEIVQQIKTLDSKQEEQLTSLLQRFNKVFFVPTTLPPERVHNHQS